MVHGEVNSSVDMSHTKPLLWRQEAGRRAFDVQLTEAGNVPDSSERTHQTELPDLRRNPRRDQAWRRTGSLRRCSQEKHRSLAPERAFQPQSTNAVESRDRRCNASSSTRRLDDNSLSSTEMDNLTRALSTQNVGLSGCHTIVLSESPRDLPAGLCHIVLGPAKSFRPSPPSLPPWRSRLPPSRWTVPCHVASRAALPAG